MPAPSGQPHSGVVYPVGLERVGPQREHYMVSYGEGDRTAKFMVVRKAALEGLLLPVDELLMGQAAAYHACALEAESYTESHRE